MNHQQIFPGFPEPRKRHPKSLKKLKKEVLEFNQMPQMVSFNPGYYTIYNDTSVMRAMRRINPQKIERKQNTGRLSRAAASRMKRAMEYLLLISQPKIYKVPPGTKKGRKHDGYTDECLQSFYTLTLSQRQKHSDNWIKSNMLNDFIDTVQKQLPGISYVWRAEPQKNGNLHFHFVSDHFIPWTYVNQVWNRIQWRNGYLDKYMEPEFDNDGEYIPKNYMNAPSVKIEKVVDPKSVRRYMRKYMVKGVDPRPVAEIQADIDSMKNKIAFEMNFWRNKKNKEKLVTYEREMEAARARKIQGKIWGCSSNLLLKPIAFETQHMGMDLRYEMQHRKLLNPENAVYFHVFKGDENFFDFIDELPDFLRGEFVDHYVKLLKEKFPPPDIIYSSVEMYSYK